MASDPDQLIQEVMRIDLELDDSSNAGKHKEVETRVEQVGTRNKGEKKGRSARKLIKWWETGEEEEKIHGEGDSGILCGSGSEKKVGKQQINEGANVNADGYIRHEYPLRLDAENCAHYMRTGTCKYGLSCRFNHPMRRRKSQGTKDTSKQREEDEDKLRQVECKGEKDCSYYIDTGSCKFGQNCRLNHPDRRPKGEGHPHSRPDNIQETASSWQSSAGSFSETAFMAPMFLSTVAAPAKVVWEGYQHLQEMLVEEFQKQNGQLKPPYPRSRSPIDRSCVLNEKGLPLRPGKDVCPHYKRYHLCKYGPACRFDHPENVVEVAR